MQNFQNRCVSSDEGLLVSTGVGTGKTKVPRNGLVVMALGWISDE